MTAPSQTPEAAGLEPCPFCGGEAWLNDYEAKYSDLPPKSRAPQCRSCGAALGYLTTPAKATEAWNRRVTAASAQAAIDAEKAKVAELERRLMLSVETGTDLLARYEAMTNRATAAEARADRLAKVLIEALPYVESCEYDNGYKPGAVMRVVKNIQSALQQETQP